MERLDVIIRYHPDYEDAALALARRLFARFDEAIDSLVLAPTTDDDFLLLLNGDCFARSANLVAPHSSPMWSKQYITAMCNEQ